MKTPESGGNKLLREAGPRSVETVILQPTLGHGEAAPDDADDVPDHLQFNGPLSMALHGEEVSRARGWATIVILLSLAVLSWIPFLSGDLIPRVVVVSSLIVTTIVSFWVWRRCARPNGYTPEVFRVFGYTVATASFPIQQFLGAFSPTPLVVTLGITFFGQGKDRKHALGIVLYAIVGYFLLATFTYIGWIPDSQVVPVHQTPTSGIFFFLIMAPLVMSVSLWMARVSRTSLDQALRESIEATNLASQREVQLNEANRELDMMLRASEGQTGLHTGSLAGIYELGRVIGRGGMGEVYSAVDPGTGRQAAVKVLRQDCMYTDNNLARFMREGRVAAKLSVPNIVKLYDVGRIEGRVPFIAMELLRGEELAVRLRREGSLDLNTVLDLATQIAIGLDCAHGAGIVHRDLKPQNLFWCERLGQWKILDFGVSKAVDLRGTLTGHDMMVGTPHYMSPEQARAGAVDYRADIFALGAVVYRCLTGRPPFDGDDIPAVLFEVAYKDPVPPSTRVAGLPGPLDAVMSIAMAKRPESRFASAGEFASALREAAKWAAGKNSTEVHGATQPADMHGEVVA